MGGKPPVRPASEPRETHVVTRLLREAAAGRRQSFDELMPLVYAELKGLARARLRDQRPGHTLTPTALVHEAYLKLVDHTQVAWQSRAQFFAIASTAMRRILLDYAKRRQAAKRGGGAVHVPLDEETDAALGDAQADALVALDEALVRLAAFDERGATVVQHRFFGGLPHRDIADVLGTSEVTVRRAWTAARAWLRQELEAGGADPAALGADAGLA